MNNANGILKIYPESFKANLYTVEPFRMIGLIDVQIMYKDSLERVTLPYFRSSGTNSGKIRGLWYPIAGIKLNDGKFTEFTPYLNFVLSHTTRHAEASTGWLAKSLFFTHSSSNATRIRGFSSGSHYEGLYRIGKVLRDLYENKEFTNISDLTPINLNKIVTSKKVYNGNNHSQRENFEKFIQDIFEGI